MINKCKVSFCERSSDLRDNGHGGFCWRHYQQMWKNGRILEKTKYDENEYIDCGNYYEISLRRGRSEQKEVIKTKIDKNDCDKVRLYKWCLMNNGYVYTRTMGKFIYLHHVILGKKSRYDVDHVDHNKLDNRKQNLRHVLHAQNIWNQKVNGYYWRKDKKRWVAYLTINKRHIYLGCFINEEDAVAARRRAEQKYFGEFAYNYN